MSEEKIELSAEETMIEWRTASGQTVYTNNKACNITAAMAAGWKEVREDEDDE